MDENVFRHYRLGISEIDNQHWDLLAYLSKIANAASEAERCDLIEHLVADLEAHFSTEAQFMRDMRFPFISAHMESHISLTKNFHDLRDRILDKTARDAAWIAKQAAQLLLTHIDHDDRQFADHHGKIAGNGA